MNCFRADIRFLKLKISLKVVYSSS